MILTLVARIPSINLPVTTESGTMHPIWYEFFRAVIANLGSGANASDGAGNVLAGAGLIGGGDASNDITLAVGAGEGIIANANDVAVDIIHQVNAQAAVEDEILIADASDQSRIRKTSLQDVANLSVANPGGASTQIQYNSNGIFGGDSGVTTDGAGNLNVQGSLVVDTMTFNGNTISTPTSGDKFSFEVPAGALDQFTFTQSGTGSSACNLNVISLKSSAGVHIKADTANVGNLSQAYIKFTVNGLDWAMGIDGTTANNDFIFSNVAGLNTGIMYTISGGTGNYFAHNTLVKRKTSATITASTTQTQGQGPLTSDINRVSTCANANDTVTLPAVEAGMDIWIFNDGANTLKIYPASGDDLGAGVNTSVTLATTGKANFISYDTTTWKQVV